MLGLLYVNQDTEKKGKDVVKVEAGKVSKRINQHTGYVITNKNAKLYKLQKHKYKKNGSVKKDSLILLDESNHNDDEYFRLKDSEYYINYHDIAENKDELSFDNDYQRYLVFNENVMTDQYTELYTIDGKLKYTLQEGINLPIYMKKNGMYYVKYMSELLGVKSTCAWIKENRNTEQINATKIPVFMYHFFYDAQANESGRDGNYTEIHIFKEQLQSALNKGYQSITMSELELYLNGSIQLPQGSFVATMDDNAESVKRLAYPVLEELKVYATNFVITGWIDDFTSIQSAYVELQSHSDGLHTGGCSGIKHGGLFNCIDYESGLQDVKRSSEKLSGAFVFCYPFGDVDENMKNILRDGGYRLAFTTKFGYVSLGMDKLELPRVRITQNTSVESFVKLLEG